MARLQDRKDTAPHRIGPRSTHHAGGVRRVAFRKISRPEPRRSHEQDGLRREPATCTKLWHVVEDGLHCRPIVVVEREGSRFGASVVAEDDLGIPHGTLGRMGEPSFRRALRRSPARRQAARGFGNAEPQPHPAAVLLNVQLDLAQDAADEADYTQILLRSRDPGEALHGPQDTRPVGLGVLPSQRAEGRRDELLRLFREPVMLQLEFAACSGDRRIDLLGVLG